MILYYTTAYKKLDTCFQSSVFMKVDGSIKKYKPKKMIIFTKKQINQFLTESKLN